ncbi:hydantoinase/oxoprolinase family protein [Fusibacter paucivorans]|uniref:Hydantoinase/oxoprolinase family protein n=1 Tax=Fusibacter paucivorans TaxID=76009 RepID=A0ABS5PRK6_9FIRM|nr:hydantoinase/oxoprolinase family protein [Fusibacter paucivorans]MBS7527497.1 hydantoinase/oxoprolinase family protein [Fusibacter paucivorans]
MKVATDIGGTFTDIVYIDKAGEIGVDKAHTTPPNFEKGVIDVIEKAGVNTAAIESFVHGTTVIINALTERKGAKTGLITTKGFRDVLDIQRGNRPDLFNMRYKKPESFVPRYLRHEINERINYKGEVLTDLDEGDVLRAIAALKKEDVEAVAVVFLHSYINDEHERKVIDMIKAEWPEVFVTGSYEVTKEWREYERTTTAVLNAFVKPVAANYIDKLYNKLEAIGIASPKYIMQSNGGTTTFEKSKETPINMVESGPVAGIFGSAMIGKLVGNEKVIGFDVGGTTAKCSLIDGGEVKVTTEYKIDQTDRFAGYPIKTPVVDIVEIGNGGGSIAWVDEAGYLRVGPQSAGALPGPVAYGKGGSQPTTTDANLVLGRLSPKNFDMDVNMDKVRESVDNIVAKPFGISTDDAALGIVRIANANMLNALKIISVRKGYDPREFAMVAFGGGGAMHAAALAKELGVKKVIIPLASSVFSALGMLMTDLRQDNINTFNIRMDHIDYDALEAKWQELEQAAMADNLTKGIAAEDVVFVRNLDMRYWGQEHTVKVLVPNKMISESNVDDIIQRFHAEHEKAYSFKMEDSMTEIVNLHLVTLGKTEKTTFKTIDAYSEDTESAVKEIRTVLFEAVGSVDTKIYDLGALLPGMTVNGPAVIEERSSSIVVYPDMVAEKDVYGNIIINTEV